jgi:tRNA pseudouridine55 synthase
MWIEYSVSEMSAAQNIGGEVLNLYKNLGETPRERLERLREQKPYYEREVLSYAGRLDPMAEGVMLCLVGQANKRREEYLDLSKEYTVDVLFGFSTDTYDILGKVINSGDASSITRERIDTALNEFRGKLDQEYPPFSSKPVEGRSLFEWARSGAVGALVMPTHSVQVYEIEIESMYKVNEVTLLNFIEASIEKVQGDFRQDEILVHWRRHLNAKNGRSFKCATIKVSCSSGTYVRSIAHSLGLELGVPALALHILRTRVGDYDISKAIK